MKFVAIEVEIMKMNSENGELRDLPSSIFRSSEPFVESPKLNRQIAMASSVTRAVFGARIYTKFKIK